MLTIHLERASADVRFRVPTSGSPRRLPLISLPPPVLTFQGRHRASQTSPASGQDRIEGERQGERNLELSLVHKGPHQMRPQGGSLCLLVDPSCGASRALGPVPPSGSQPVHLSSRGSDCPIGLLGKWAPSLLACQSETQCKGFSSGGFCGLNRPPHAGSANPALDVVEAQKKRQEICPLSLAICS